MSLGYVAPSQAHPLPAEHRYRLRMRCLGCQDDVLPAINLGVRRLTRVEVDQKVKHMAKHIQPVYPHCEGTAFRLVNFFVEGRQ